MPNWLSWAAHSHLPLPSLRTYAVMSLGVFLGAVLNCTSLSSSGKSGSGYSHEYILPLLVTTQSDKGDKEGTGTISAVPVHRLQIERVMILMKRNHPELDFSRRFIYTQFMD